MPRPNSRPCRLVWAAAALAAACPAHADLVEIDWGADQRFERSLQVAPGRFAEVCGRLAKGSAVRWSFSAGGPLDFNIHYHAGKKVLFPVKQDGSAGAHGTLTATQQQDYCWMWTNPSAHPASLELRLAR